MSETKPIRITMEDAKNFYDKVYKASALEKIEQLKDEEQNSLKNDSLALKQFSYRQLAEDFLVVTKERLISNEEVLKYLSMGNETWNIWRSSVALGANKSVHTTPVTFKTETVLKMSAMVLKDIVSKYMLANGLDEIDEQGMKDVFDVAKLRTEKGSVHDAFFRNEVEKQESKKPNKIKP